MGGACKSPGPTILLLLSLDGTTVHSTGTISGQQMRPRGARSLIIVKAAWKSPLWSYFGPGALRAPPIVAMASVAGRGHC